MLVASLSITTIAAAGAATAHRLAVSQTGGSEGAQAFFQNVASSSALQGEVGGSSPNTNVKIPFGVLGEYDAPGSNFGIGLVGISTTGYAIGGESLSGQPSILAYPGGGGIGLEAVSQSSSSAAAVYGEAKGSGNGGQFMSDGGGYGLYAYSNDNDGIFGASPVGQGVEGETYGGSGAGVEGDSLSASFGDGVYGTSSDGDGVHGDISTTQGHAGVVGTNEGTGTGVYGASASGIGTTGIEYTAASPMPSADPSTYAGIYGQSQTGPGVYGVDEHNSGNPVLYGDATGIRPDFFSALYGYANDGPGIFTYSSNDFGAVITNGGSVAPTLVLNNNTAGGVGDLIDAASGAIKTDQPVFTVANDGSIFTNGNITYAGTETHQAVTRTAGSTVGTYSSQQSEATIEDVGSAQLAGGSASVAIAADFRDTIDGSRPYMVFLTPYGDNRGLYIASRSASGFVVKEAQGGHSSLAFDYRIVAHPYGTRLARLPHIRSARMANKNQYSVASRPAAFNGAAPDTMAASRANGAALRAADAVRRKAVLADRARHQFVHGVAPPLPSNPFGLVRAGAAQH